MCPADNAFSVSDTEAHALARPASGDELTILLSQVASNTPGAQDRLAERIFDDLRAMAHRRLGHNPRNITLQPTMLASDTLMQLIRQRQKFDNAGHLFAIASRLMMRILIDYQRQRHAAKRGGSDRDAARVSLDPDRVLTPAGPDIDIEALDRAMEKLAQLDARKADVVKYRVLWEFTMPEVAKALGVALATVERDWAFAKAWLARELANTQ
jgi:RNA polymerase sigma factor (TIGR02999 family)